MSVRLPRWGDTVLFTMADLPNFPGAGQTRPALVMHVHKEDPFLVWLAVLTKGEEDGLPGEHGFGIMQPPQVPYDPCGARRSWRWPEDALPGEKERMSR